jgi:hypothetical protein
LIRVALSDDECVRAALGDVDNAGLADRHERYPEPGNEEAYGMSRPNLGDILQQARFSTACYDSCYENR